ncbi:unnamed protein product [Zymoseptoria tritici ST99CH_1E4]|uniref:Uncharacterized protein n=1 Tax=Zymoseptoria tritici ST99CH_1E4 TaxID=1276532 RepID=A0A2H1FWV4_ZYMTR|nr:unnamed protein product [Zymoseptoria tritici ST99CH_1E4]
MPPKQQTSIKAAFVRRNAQALTIQHFMSESAVEQYKDEVFDRDRADISRTLQEAEKHQGRKARLLALLVHAKDERLAEAPALKAKSTEEVNNALAPLRKWVLDDAREELDKVKKELREATAANNTLTTNNNQHEKDLKRIRRERSTYKKERDDFEKECEKLTRERDDARAKVTSGDKHTSELAARKATNEQLVREKQDLVKKLQTADDEVKRLTEREQGLEEELETSIGWNEPLREAKNSLATQLTASAIENRQLQEKNDKLGDKNKRLASNYTIVFRRFIELAANSRAARREVVSLRSEVVRLVSVNRQAADARTKLEARIEIVKQISLENRVRWQLANNLKRQEQGQWQQNAKRLEGEILDTTARCAQLEDENERLVRENRQAEDSSRRRLAGKEATISLLHFIQENDTNRLARARTALITTRRKLHAMDASHSAVAKSYQALRKVHGAMAKRVRLTHAATAKHTRKMQSRRQVLVRRIDSLTASANARERLVSRLQAAAAQHTDQISSIFDGQGLVEAELRTKTEELNAVIDAKEQVDAEVNEVKEASELLGLETGRLEAKNGKLLICLALGLTMARLFIRWHRQRIGHLNGQVANLNGRLDTLTNANGGLLLSLNSSRILANWHRLVIASMRQTSIARAGQITTLNAQITNLNGQVVNLNGQVQVLTTTNAGLHASLASSRVLTSWHRLIISSTRRTNVALASQITGLNERLTSSRVLTSWHRLIISSTRRTNVALAGQITSLNGQLASSRVLTSWHRLIISSTRRTNVALAGQITGLNERLTSSRVLTSWHRLIISSTRRTNVALAGQITSLNGQLASSRVLTSWHRLIISSTRRTNVALAGQITSLNGQLASLTGQVQNLSTVNAGLVVNLRTSSVISQWRRVVAMSLDHANAGLLADLQTSRTISQWRRVVVMSTINANSTLAGQATNLNTQVTNLNTQVTNLSGQVTDLSGQVRNLTTVNVGLVASVRTSRAIAQWRRVVVLSMSQAAAARATRITNLTTHNDTLLASNTSLSTNVSNGKLLVLLLRCSTSRLRSELADARASSNDKDIFVAAFGELICEFVGMPHVTALTLSDTVALADLIRQVIAGLHTRAETAETLANTRNGRIAELEHQVQNMTTESRTTANDMVARYREGISSKHTYFENIITNMERRFRHLRNRLGVPTQLFLAVVAQMTVKLAIKDRQLQRAARQAQVSSRRHATAMASTVPRVLYDTAISQLTVQLAIKDNQLGRAAREAQLALQQHTSALAATISHTRHAAAMATTVPRVLYNTAISQLTVELRIKDEWRVNAEKKIARLERLLALRLDPTTVVPRALFNAVVREISLQLRMRDARFSRLVRRYNRLVSQNNATAMRMKRLQYQDVWQHMAGPNLLRDILRSTLQPALYNFEREVFTIEVKLKRAEDQAEGWERLAKKAFDDVDLLEETLEAVPSSVEAMQEDVRAAKALVEKERKAYSARVSSLEEQVEDHKDQAAGWERIAMKAMADVDLAEEALEDVQEVFGEEESDAE